MKKLDRYILLEFFSPFGLIVIGFASLVMLIQFVDTLPGFREWKAPFSLILAYHACKLPYLAAQVTPVAVMLSSLICLGNLARHGEIAAMRSGGISPLRIGKPLLAASLAISLGLLAISEFVVPLATDQARYIQKVLIEHRNMNWGSSSWREKMTLKFPGGRQVFVDRYDGEKGELWGVLVADTADGRFCSRTDAATGKYENGQWFLYNGIERDFAANGSETHVTLFDKKPIIIQEKPEDLMVESGQREEDLLALSIRHLSRIIKILKTTGADYHQELVCKHILISYPFSCFVLALLGVSLPFLFPYGRRAVVGAAVGIVVSLATGMLYLVFIQVGLSLGKSNLLPAVVAAWIGNAVFTVVGFAALRKAGK